VEEYLTPHVILRKALMQNMALPKVAEDLGLFLARTLFGTSDLHYPADIKKQRMAVFCGNTAMCKITEDIVFTEPFHNAPLNRHTLGLEDTVTEFHADSALKRAVQDLKYAFLTRAESLLHGDLHTGSVMVTATDTRVIDPEFAFYGPAGFDLGMLIANFLTAFFARDEEEDRTVFTDYIVALMRSFEKEFRHLWMLRTAETGGAAYSCLLPDIQEAARTAFLKRVWHDAVGFCGVEIIRRITGLAHLEEFESIKDETVRAARERRALHFARSLILHPEVHDDAEKLCRAAASR
jgi:5-methylthioribose kinase